MRRLLPPNLVAILVLSGLCVAAAPPAGAEEPVGIGAPTTAGARLWVKRYDGPASSDDSATALGVSPDGTKVFVTGYSHGRATSADYATVAYSIG